MNALIFHVKGSAKEPYRIIAEGEGDQLKAFCSCPAGKKGGTFCKHISYLLHGDMSKLVSPSVNDVAELARRAKGSPLMAKAGVRIDKDMSQAEATGLTALADVFAKFKAEFEGLGWTVALVERDGERDEDRVELFATYKNGNLRKRPSIVFEYVRLGYEEGAYEFGGFEGEEEILLIAPPSRPRDKPFGIRTTGGRSIGKTWKHLPDALTAFLSLARKGPEGNNR